MIAWAERIVQQACDKKLGEVQSVVDHFDRKIVKMQEQLDKLNERLNGVDKTIMAMTKDDLDRFMTNRMVVFEGGIDDKIVGLYRAVDEKVSSGNGHVKATATLLKRIAVLEGLKEVADSRRPTDEVLVKLDAYKKKLLAMDRTDNGFDRYQDAINILNWVLGENNE